MNTTTLATELAAKNEVNTKAYNALVAHIKNVLEANIDNKVAEVSCVTDSMAEITIKNDKCHYSFVIYYDKPFGEKSRKLKLNSECFGSTVSNTRKRAASGYRSAYSCRGRSGHHSYGKEPGSYNLPSASWRGGCGADSLRNLAQYCEHRESDAEALLRLCPAPASKGDGPSDEGRCAAG